MTLSARQAATIFLAFAFTYFLAAVLRAVTATLAPVFSQELNLQASDLGLLAGAYFLGFAALQLPLGRALDHFGPRRTLLCLLGVAVLGCIAFALAPGLPTLTAARLFMGAGVGGCLMAPLTLYRRLFSPSAQLRANSWMLMTGSLGMVASTLPVQWLLPAIGWRGLFWLIAALLIIGMLLVAVLVPLDERHPAANITGAIAYSRIIRHPLFMATAPLAFFLYGGMIAVQSLWAGPWLTRVVHLSATQAAQGLFLINLSMLAAFLTWGAVMPKLVSRGVGVPTLMAWGLPLPLLVLIVNAWLGSRAGAAHWALWCVCCTFVSLSQPAVGAAFPPRQAGRALSAYNLVIFSGVFCTQWGLGLLIDALRANGVETADAFRIAMAGLAACSAAAYAWFLYQRPGSS
jgi:predicted MFS family arabinose efflux permease